MNAQGSRRSDSSIPASPPECESRFFECLSGGRALYSLDKTRRRDFSEACEFSSITNVASVKGLLALLLDYNVIISLTFNCDI